MQIKRPGHAEIFRGLVLVDVFQIFFDLSESHNRSGDQLRKQRHVTGKLKEIARRFDGATIAVDDVGDRMKGIKGNADRQNDIQMLRMSVDAQPRKQPAQVFECEVGVFEESKQRKIDRNWKDQAQLLHPRVVFPTQKTQSRIVANQGRKQHQKAEFVIPLKA